MLGSYAPGASKDKLARCQQAVRSYEGSLASLGDLGEDGLSWGSLGRFWEPLFGPLGVLWGVPWGPWGVPWGPKF